MADAVMMDNLDRNKVYVVRENTLDMAVHLITFWSPAKNRWQQEYADAVPADVLAAMTPANRAIVMRAARANLGLDCEKSTNGSCGSCQHGSCDDCSGCNC